MKYTEITVCTTSLGSELVGDIFWRYTEDGVAISDVNDVIALSREKKGTWDYIEENLLAPAPVLCKGYVPAGDGARVKKIEEELRALKATYDFDKAEIGYEQRVAEAKNQNRILAEDREHEEKLAEA